MEELALGEAAAAEESDIPDGGWGWVVTLAATVIFFVVTIPSVSFGVLFSDMLLGWDTSFTVTSWVFNLGLVFAGLCSFLTAPLVDEFGWRKVALTSGFLMGLGLTFSAGATSVWFLLFSFSFLAGCNMWILVCIAYLVMLHYFLRWRRVSNAIIVLGVCISQMTMPPLITYLQEEYGSVGAILITGAVSFNCCPAAMLLHPVEWHKQRSYPTTSSKKDENPLPGNTPGTSACLMRILSKSRSCLQLLKSPVVITIAIMIGMHMTVVFNVFTAVPFAMEKVGFSLQDASLCLAVAGGCSLASRVVSALATFCPGIRARTIFLSGSFLTSVSITGFSLVDTLVEKAVTLGLCGFGYGLAMSLTGLVVVEEVGLSMLLPVLSVSFFMSGVLFLIVGPVSGVVRDVTDSYVASLCFVAACLLFSVVVGVLLPVAHILHQRRQHQQQSQEQEQQQDEESWQKSKKTRTETSSLLHQPVPEYMSVKKVTD